MEIKVFDPGHGRTPRTSLMFGNRRSMCGLTMPTRWNGSPPTMRPPAATICAFSPRLRRRGGRASQKLRRRDREGPVVKQGARGTLRSVYCRDPDGSLIEISSYEGVCLNACPGRGAAFFMPLRRAGTVPKTVLVTAPLCSHRFAKGGALRCVRGTREEAANRAAWEKDAKLTAAGRCRPFAGLDVPWLLQMRAENPARPSVSDAGRRRHPGAQMELWRIPRPRRRAGAGLVARGIKPGDYLLIHLDNCIEAMLAWFACVELGAIAVTTNTRFRTAEMDYFAGHCGAVAAITQPAYAEIDLGALPGLRWIAVISGAAPAHRPQRADAFESLFADSADRPAARSIHPALQRAVYFRHHVRGRRRCCGLTPTRYAAVPHQRAGLFDAGQPVGRRILRDPAPVFREPVLNVAAEDGCSWTSPSVLHEGAAGARDPERHTFRLWGTAVNDPPPFRVFASKSSAGGA